MSEFLESIIDWEKFDASSKISQRLNGVSKESVELEVQIWEKQLKLLPKLNYQEINDEVGEWQIEMPSSLTFENIAITYTRLVNYKTRVSKLLADAKAWRETAESAAKYLEDLAQGAFTGTGVDKKANALFVAQPFVHLKIQASRLENYLNQVHGSIMFCASQLDLLIKEKQSRAKLNLKLSHQGEGLIADMQDNSSEILEENGEIFYQIKPKNSVKTR